MEYITFTEKENNTYNNVIFVHKLRKDLILKEYITPLGLDPAQTIAVKLHQSKSKKKTPASERIEFLLTEIDDLLESLQTKYLFVADGEYFKTICKQSKVEPWIGYKMQSDAYPGVAVFYLPPAEAAFHDPVRFHNRIRLIADSFVLDQAGLYQPPGTSIISKAEYPSTVSEIRLWLNRLVDMNAPLTCDIEGFSLRYTDTGVGTITFCWNQNEGIAFRVDYTSTLDEAVEIRLLLKDFFRRFNNKIIYHNITFDVSALVYQLFMDDITDQQSLLTGLEVMLKNWDDTKLIAYLATNSCAGNDNSLKALAQEFAGNYAMSEINDITKIDIAKLLTYNLVDGLSTWFVYNKYYPKMIEEQQLEIYETIFKPAVIDIIQMQLTGFPVDMQRVREVIAVLQKDSDEALKQIMSSDLVREFTEVLMYEWVEEKNATYKKKRVTMSDAEGKVIFNPNSGPQLIKLLYTYCGLPVIDTTDSNLPATGAATLKKLVNHTQDERLVALLKALQNFKAVDKILTTTMPAMLNAVPGKDGWHYLIGNFNLGGTVSGRLSSSNPNLQNLPATGTKYAKIVKSCFRAPPGWILCGIDSNSLEDRISALTTKDPEKLKVYTDGYDGHCMRAFAYFGALMPLVQQALEEVRKGGKVYKVSYGEETHYVSESHHLVQFGSNYPREELSLAEAEVAIINSIDTLYKALRQESKAPTFALTYQGTYKTLMNNCGFSMEKAQSIEASFKKLYAASIKWVNDRLDKASRTGYVQGAFGLKVRTPLLKQVVRGTRQTPYAAEAEGRTAGNALGQSWCLLNSRAGSEFMGKVRASEFSLMIRSCAQIHDAQYFMVKDDLDAIRFANEHVVKACEWQNHPDIWHDEVKLGGQFFLCLPSWEHEIEIPNGASENQIVGAIEKYVQKMAEKGIELNI